jgi:hypothetical protein
LRKKDEEILLISRWHEANLKGNEGYFIIGRRRMDRGIERTILITKIVMTMRGWTGVKS